MLSRKAGNALAALCLIGLAACGGANDDQSASPGPAVTPTFMPVEATTTPESRTSPTLEGGVMKITVTDFQVWQDFMPRLGEGGPPLHATLLVEIEGAGDLDLTGASGTITIARPSGEEITQSSLRRAEGGEDTVSPSGGPKQVLFAMQSTTTTLPLKENEPLVGRAELEIGGAPKSLELPPTTLMFTH